MNWSWLLKSGEGIPVLMYHKVWPGINDDLTITPERLRDHWTYLRDEGYHTLSLDEYISIALGKRPLPEKAILLTFDDGYQNNLTYVYPLLKEFGWRATFFIIAGTLEGAYKEMGQGAGKKMVIGELRLLDPRIVQLGLHGYRHENLGDVPREDVATILKESIRAFDESALPYHKVLAYPYGSRPKDKERLLQLKQAMNDSGIFAAFRIGNKVSEIPAPDRYEIKRIDIKGTDTVNELKIKMKKGKLKPF